MDFKFSCEIIVPKTIKSVINLKMAETDNYEDKYF